MSIIRVRAREPHDVEAINEIMTCPGVIAGTLQLPYRSVEERRERYEQHRPETHSLVAELDGRVVGLLGLHTETVARRPSRSERTTAVSERPAK